MEIVLDRQNRPILGLKIRQWRSTRKFERILEREWRITPASARTRRTLTDRFRGLRTTLGRARRTNSRAMILREQGPKPARSQNSRENASAQAKTLGKRDPTDRPENPIPPQLPKKRERAQTGNAMVPGGTLIRNRRCDPEATSTAETLNDRSPENGRGYALLAVISRRRGVTLSPYTPETPENTGVLHVVSLCCRLPVAFREP